MTREELNPVHPGEILRLADRLPIEKIRAILKNIERN